MKLNRFLIVLLITVAFALSSCSDSFLNTKQQDYVTSEELDDVLLNSPTQKIAFVRDMQAYMITFGAATSTSHDDFGYMAILHSGDMMADDMALLADGSKWFMFDQALSNGMETYRRTRIQWYTMYTLISKANELIGRLDENDKNPENLAFLAQAYAYRALGHYTILPFYQHIYQGLTGANKDALGIPIRLSRKETSIASRATVKQVFEQIQKDYEKSIALFAAAGDAWKRPDKNFINAKVANGLAARYYLMTEQWEKALDAATAAMKEGALMTADEYLAGFSDLNNPEWIWGMKIDAINSTGYASFFSHISNLSPGYAGKGAYRAINKALYNKFHIDDKRRLAYDSLTLKNLKFGLVVNYQNDLPYMRVAEMYLIKAEAEARLGKTSEAASTLSTLLAKRYTIPPVLATVTVDDVLLQRRIELWGEGFSLFDLKRTNTGIVRSYKESNFQEGYRYNAPMTSSAFLLQLPLTEMTDNPAVVGQQNPAPEELTPL